MRLHRGTLHPYLKGARCRASNRALHRLRIRFMIDWTPLFYPSARAGPSPSTIHERIQRIYSENRRRSGCEEFHVRSLHDDLRRSAAIAWRWFAEPIESSNRSRAREADRMNHASHQRRQPPPVLHAELASLAGAKARADARSAMAATRCCGRVELAEAATAVRLGRGIS
jgi:hypothetical protein